MSDLILIIGTIAGMIGGARIYAKWNSGGGQNIDAEIISWFLACLFLCLLGGTLKALFNI